MTMIRLTEAESARLEGAHRLYMEAFPPEERRAWQSIVHPADAAGPHLLIVEDAGGLAAGFVTVWRFDTFIYVEHLAVEPCRRGGGIGAAVIRAIESDYGLPIALEVEMPDDANPMAARRIAFYERCGLAVLDYDYIQPPYADNLPEVPLLLMASPGAPDAAVIARTLHSRVYGVPV